VMLDVFRCLLLGERCQTPIELDAATERLVLHQRRAQFVRAREDDGEKRPLVAGVGGRYPQIAEVMGEIESVSAGEMVRFVEQQQGTFEIMRVGLTLSWKRHERFGQGRRLIGKVQTPQDVPGHRETAVGNGVNLDDGELGFQGAAVEILESHGFSDAVCACEHPRNALLIDEVIKPSDPFLMLLGHID